VPRNGVPGMEATHERSPEGEFPGVRAPQVCYLRTLSDVQRWFGWEGWASPRLTLRFMA
jgi:hypothetical protein